MSVSGVNSTINTNPQVQQQKSKSKAKAPLYGVGAGAIAGGSIAAVDGYFSKKSVLNETLRQIEHNQKYLDVLKSESAGLSFDNSKKSMEATIKEVAQTLENLNAKLPELKKAVKPIGVLKFVAKAPITYILATTGLVVGLCANHKNKSAKQ